LGDTANFEVPIQIGIQESTVSPPKCSGSFDPFSLQANPDLSGQPDYVSSYIKSLFGVRLYVRSFKMEYYQA